MHEHMIRIIYYFQEYDYIPLLGQVKIFLLSISLVIFIYALIFSSKENKSGRNNDLFKPMNQNKSS